MTLTLTLALALALARQPRFSLRAVLGGTAFLLSRRDFTCWAVPD